jgi:YD repeat-containing protein
MDTLSRFEYDNEGNRTFEAYTTNASGNARSYYQFAEVSYDELNRVVKVLDPKAEIRYEYDAVGNRRRVWSYYHDGINGSTALQDYWYDYDSMNRFVISMGKLTNGARGSSASDTAVAVVRGPDGGCPKFCV